jgi:catalase
VDFSLATTGSVLFDAVFVPGGADSVKTLSQEGMAVLFVTEAYKHCKAIAATGEGVSLLPTDGKPVSTTAAPAKAAPARSVKAGTIEEGVVIGGDGDVAKVAAEFIKAIASHRAWTREAKAQRIPV